MADTLKIVHMMSMARSGETMLVKLFNAHSKVVISHNLYETEKPEGERLFHVLKGYCDKNIAANHDLLRHLDIQDKQVLFLKQGVWEHPAPFDGFVVLRNPMAIYSSLKRYDKPRDKAHLNELWQKLMLPRFVRWSKDIDAGLAKNIEEATSPVEMFCVFHKRRFEILKTLSNPVFRYEDICRQPERYLKKICAGIELEFEEQMLSAHTAYPENFIGHGTNDLSKPISTQSLDLWKSELEASEISFINEYLSEFMQQHYTPSILDHG